MTPPTDTAEPHVPLVRRLADDFGADWVDESSVAAWTARDGDRVVLLAGDPVRYPEGVDVAAVLPELMKAFAGRFAVAVAPREHEDAIARRYGAQRWPTLLFFRAGRYVTAIGGMKDWDVYLQLVDAALKMQPTRPPTIGIPVISQNAPDACH
jgi:hydrogenase-1 operon protein HyaE